MTVGLLHALFAYTGRQVPAEELAERACTIEIERCGKPIGKQDQYIAALGGIRDLHFGPGDRRGRQDLDLPARQRRALQQQIMLFYTGVTRSANTILAEQSANIGATLPQLDRLRDLAGVRAPSSCAAATLTASARRSGRAGRRSGSWPQGSPTTRSTRLVSAALDAGATGVKLTGAGGGGFLLVICPMERQRRGAGSAGAHARAAGEAGPARLAGGAERDPRYLVLTGSVPRRTWVSRPGSAGRAPQRFEEVGRRGRLGIQRIFWRPVMLHPGLHSSAIPGP